MFLVHGKNGLFINSCVSNRNTESNSETPDADAVDDAARSDAPKPSSSVPVWSLNRFARHYSRSPNNQVAIVDDRLGLSILHVKGEDSSDFTFDTLRGVGKFRNHYTPIGCKNIKHLQWSNNGVYLVIYFNLNNCSKETGMFSEDNLHIWDITLKCIVGSFSTRRLSPEQWPVIKWVGYSDKFAYCFGQQVSIYAISTPDGTPTKSTRLLLSIQVPRVFSVEVFSADCLPPALRADGTNSFIRDDNGIDHTDLIELENAKSAMELALSLDPPGLSDSETSDNADSSEAGTGTDATPTSSGTEEGEVDESSVVESDTCTASIKDAASEPVTADATPNTGNRTVVDSDSDDDDQSSIIRVSPKDFWMSLSAYTKADIATQVSGNLRIATIQCVNSELYEVSSCDHELRTEDSADMYWSPSGRSLLVLGQSTVDLAGEKYGATSNCFLFRASGLFVCQVNSETTHDVRWCPNRDEFIIMQGNMPCDITLFSADCVRLFEFPKLYRNTIRWNPLGNMVALCGFGNLAGEICFWYRKDQRDYEQIVHMKEPCTVISEWSHDSRYFMTASTYPRMKVDNFLKIFTHEGDLLESQKMEECYEVCWMGSADTEWQFTRPSVRKSAQRKAVYRPKLLSRDDAPKRVIGTPTLNPTLDVDGYYRGPKPPPGATMSKFPLDMCAPDMSHPMANHMMHNRGSPHYPPFPGVPRPPGEVMYRGSMFSNDYGDKNDPSLSLLDAFRHVFSLSQARPPPMPMQYDCPPPERLHMPPEEPFGGDSVSLSADRRPVQHGRGPGGVPPVHNNVTADDAAKSLSMLMRIKNQMQCEKSKPLQQTILDEVQLLKLLLEAKNRSISRTRND
ncbi:GYF domain-containing protein [Babesia caballi]|uniref:GYF domain-containing protein n=1 Tax=Babesia caballi TaxID=5871 RepID=A0AAV4LLU9_BABCB|nr:GYF domain-containing protein [Babesia caballi]